MGQFKSEMHGHDFVGSVWCARKDRAPILFYCGEGSTGQERGVKLRNLFFILFALALTLSSSYAFGTIPHPQVFSGKMDSIPDLGQTDPTVSFPHGGIHLCGPVAVSNSLMWLARQGYRRLLPNIEEPKACQAALTMRISSEEYMDTTLEYGTSPSAVLVGLSRYIKDCGYEYRRLEYQGCRKHPREFSTGVSVPELSWIKKGLLGDSAVFLNIGWYEHPDQINSYRRIGGHWVTLVGFGFDETGKTDPDILIVHDPASKTGNANEFVRFERISEGRLSGVNGTHNAAGFLKIVRGIRIDSKADCAILDGVIVLEMQKAKPESSRRNTLSEMAKLHG
jgi:hypothetical protein